jgi:uncharacterized repeat protein (TIGR01451 family)
MRFRRADGDEANVARMTKLVVVAMAIGVALVLLGACAWQSQATAPPAGTQVAAETLAPTGVPASASVPSPMTGAGPAGERSATTVPAADAGPSDAGAAIPAAPGETGTYSVTIHRPRRDLSTGIVSTGVVSEGVAPLLAERSRPVCGRIGRDVGCDLGDVRAGDVVTVSLDLGAPMADTLITGTVAPPEATSALTATDLVVQATGPSTVVAGQPVTYTYTISNRGESEATDVQFDDVIPSDMDLVAYAPGLPDCDQVGDAFTCTLRDPGGGEAVTFTLIITGYGDQPRIVSLDPLLPGWPICTVLKERTWLHVVQCELGDMKPGQATRVELVLTAVGVVERTTANAAFVGANEVDLNPVDNTITTTITVQTGASQGGE